ncbi:phosphonate ABC transporter, permease protein PhnE [Hutsoniella sourekii]|uniref:phosphonate ABC transporter, permease protein PhnE n=1 Tax=Hutsoniella sourekii TaxID=87650 RepID=UPI0004AD4DCD|nr:phosphonate ABC transporter, permease protein PhnE [Hutsoniella sourekii]
MPTISKMKTSHKSLLLALALILIITFVSLDYSNLSNLRLADIGNIFKGLLAPDWSYVWDGSSEDLTHLMLETIAIAFYGTVVGSILCIPFVLLASDAVWGSWTLIPRLGRGLLNLMRSVPALIYGILFVRIVGPGAFAGSLALGVQLIGMLGKLISEELDRADEAPVEAMTAAGASGVQAFQYARLPQVLPLAASHILNHFEINVRSATTLGLVGAGGIGAPIIFALQQRNWSRVSIILLAIIVVVLIIDLLSTQVRKRLK